MGTFSIGNDFLSQNGLMASQNETLQHYVHDQMAYVHHIIVIRTFCDKSDWDVPAWKNIGQNIFCMCVKQCMNQTGKWWGRKTQCTAISTVSGYGWSCQLPWQMYSIKQQLFTIKCFFFFFCCKREHAWFCNYVPKFSVITLTSDKEALSVMQILWLQ